MKIMNQKNGKLNEQDRLELLRLLGKAGYAVRIGREKPAEKSASIIYVEYWGDEREV